MGSETKFWLARELIGVLEQSSQDVPQELRDLVDRDSTFENECKEGMLRLKFLESPLVNSEGYPATCGGDFDSEKGLWILPPTLPSYRRKLLHWMSDELGLPHVSTGESPNRRLHIARERESLPEKFFMEGEEVLVESRREGGWASRAIVIDPKIKAGTRTLRVRFRGGNEAVVLVDKVSLAAMEYVF